MIPKRHKFTIYNFVEGDSVKGEEIFHTTCHNYIKFIAADYTLTSKDFTINYKYYKTQIIYESFLMVSSMAWVRERERISGRCTVCIKFWVI